MGRRGRSPSSVTSRRWIHGFLRGARFHRYGVTIYVGVGIPIPVLDEEMARSPGSPTPIY